MKLLYDVDDGAETIDLEMIDLDGYSLTIEYVKGYGQTDINLLGSYITWDQLDVVKKGIEFAERQWREKE